MDKHSMSFRKIQPLSARFPFFARDDIMDKNFSSELQGFEEVWKRVSAGRAKPKAPAGLMPGKQQKSKAVRFCGDPPRRG